MGTHISPQQAVVQPPQGRAATQKRSVQPDALIARLQRVINNRPTVMPCDDNYEYGFRTGLNRAINEILSEAKDAEHNAAG